MWGTGRNDKERKRILGDEGEDLKISLSVAVKDLMEMLCFCSRGKNPMDELPTAPQTHTPEQLLSLAKCCTMST
ncbi:hypothetical protein IHE44_0006447 [Lamprotornis superbus]|uniref:Uncharacterized protein n=1 Tax=Lamprotornis superbus TaxID=245042 RepID=A0A835NSE1_9PASS|nr:hypothetical protein IHE44_0006447 [Lamprotornis superbus]